MNAQIEFKKHGYIARIRFNRPEVKNALDMQMCEQLAEFIETLHDNSEVRVILFESTGKDFCSGADVGGMGSLVQGASEQRTALVHKAVREVSQRIFLQLARLPQPIVVSVRGYAIGAGFQFVAMADLVIASETARFSIPQVLLAHTTDHGESYFLPRKVGAARAAQIMLLGDQFDAAEAERYGLVNWVVSDDRLNERAEEIAGRLAGGASSAVFGMKRLLKNSLQNDIDQQFDAEYEAVGQYAATEDFVEAINAFNERRSPVFRGS